jgi:hypothetical protein
MAPGMVNLPLHGEGPGILAVRHFVRSIRDSVHCVYLSLNTQGSTVDGPALEKQWGNRMTRCDEFLRGNPLAGQR